MPLSDVPYVVSSSDLIFMRHLADTGAKISTNIPRGESNVGQNEKKESVGKGLHHPYSNRSNSPRLLHQSKRCIEQDACLKQAFRS